MKKVHIFDLGVTQYVDLLRDAENARLIKRAKRSKKFNSRFLSRRIHLQRSN